jgi:4-amino-4-deoxy-L-arabinose transferase-like glycosyltransferase
MMQRLLVRAIPLAAIVLLGIMLRLIFFQGIIHFDDLLYSHLARRLADGISPFTQPLPPKWGALRIGMYGPVAIVYWLFGTSEAATLAWPFLLSILGILAAYGIGRLAHGESAGLLAAFIFAVLPTNVAAGTAFLPDGPIATLSAAAVFFLLLSSRVEGGRSAAALLASLACFALGLVCKPLMLLLLPFYLLYALAQARRSPLGLAAAALAVGGALVGYFFYFGLPRGSAPSGGTTFLSGLAQTAIDAWSQLVVGQPEFSWIAPLCIVAVAALLAWRKTEPRVVMLWLAVTFLYGELGTRSPTSYTPIVWYDAGTPARHFLFVATPAVILAGIYLAYGLKEQAARRVVTIAAIVTAVAAWLGSRGATNMNWGITGEAAADLPFATLSGLATIVAVFGAIASPALIAAESSFLRAIGMPVLVIAIGLASLQHSYLATNQFRAPWAETLPQVVRFLDSQPPMPILVQNETFGQRLDYMSGYRLGFHTVLRPFVKNPQILIAPADVNAVKDMYVLVDEFHLATAAGAKLSEGPPYLRTPPARWVKIAEFGKYPGNHLKVYRISDRTAADDLASARAAVNLGRNPSTLRHLLDAAVGAGSYCEAARVWFDLRATTRQEVESFNPVPMLTECYKTTPAMAGPSLLQNADFSNGLASWSKSPTAEGTAEVLRDADGSNVWHGTLRNGDGALIYQQQVLKPDTAYVYEADVKSTVPVAALYWQSDVGRFLEQRIYPEWTHLVYVFITPRWSGDPYPTGFDPVLVMGAGEAWVKGLRLSELGAPK